MQAPTHPTETKHGKTSLRFTPIVLLTLMLTSVGCARQQLQYQGSTVQAVQQLNRTDCENLGPVYGKGGGAFGGEFISDEKLMEYATNALRNEAGTRGATHVTFNSHEMGAAADGTSTATATIVGIAWKCAPNDTPPATEQTTVATHTDVEPKP